MIKQGHLLIKNIVKDSLFHIETEKTVPPGQAPRGIYVLSEHYDDLSWFIKNHYSDSQLTSGRATITFANNKGVLINRWELGHLVYRAKRSPISKRFVALSYNLKLHIYYPDDEEKIEEKDSITRYRTDIVLIKDISENIATRYHIRCVDLSDNQEFIYYSNWNSIVKLNHSLFNVDTWEIPDKKWRQSTATKEEERRALSILGLQKNACLDEIRKAFRKQLLKVHPDINTSDPKATEKTRLVVDSYEILTRGKEEISDQDQDEIIQFKYGGDSITATQIKNETKDLYVGCYSGRIFLVKSDGSCVLVHNCNGAVRKIKSNGKYLYIVTDYFWDILEDGLLINRVMGGVKTKQFIFGESCIVLITHNDIIQLYSLSGIPFAEVVINEKILDAFIDEKNIRIYTRKKSHLFRYITPSSYDLIGLSEYLLK